MDSSPDDSRYAVRAVDRALDVVRCIAEHPEPLTVDAVVAATGLPKTTVFRVLATLTAGRFLTRDPVRQTYRFGEIGVLVGARALGDVEVKRLARPFLERLMADTGETVHLSILNGDWALCVDKIDPPRAVRMLSYVGFRDPLHCSGVGKALLAFQPPAEREALIARVGLDRRTPRTITDRDALRQHLASVREQGCALDDGEVEEGLVCVAAPVHDHHGQTVASISASGPSTRIGGAALERLRAAVIDTAHGISRALGYLPERDTP